ncbi:hypothetical protein [Candidatus Neptunichlamydia sp. REUL1]|uniref:hypothetical protein n=1 Tax=Candidatus Neptunichlamydia sp. REUL1 TaxID=3064277 RepID=UPI00292D1516|nr:hypothetical protein [Candidatus Neptunochlamydia sp. REUL1]
MLATKVESRDIVHHDAIHYTNLLNGVKVNVGKSVEDGWEVIDTESEDRYHIQTICRQIADEFFKNRGVEEYIPYDFQARPILSIESDSEFRRHALIEFAEKTVVEELPDLYAPRDELLGTLTSRLVEVFETSGMESGYCRLDLGKMREIRDEVFGGERRVKERKSIALRRDHHVIPLGSQVHARSNASLQGARRRSVDDPESCFSPTVVAGAGLLSGFFVVAALFNKMFADEKEQGQRVSRVDKFTLNTQVNSRGTIY